MPEAQAPLAAPASPAELFRACTRLALQGFGGVLPVAQRELVERLHWLTREQFLEQLSVAQVLPGPNIVNLLLIIGDRLFGWRGALAATAGILLAPLAVVLLLAVAVDRLNDVPGVAGALRGMGVVAAGLVLSTAFKLLGGLRRNPLGPVGSALAVVLTVGAIAVLRLPLALVVIGLGSLSCLGAAWRLRR